MELSPEKIAAFIQARPKSSGYLNAMAGSAGHAVMLILRRRRFALVALVAFMPVVIPLAMAFLSRAQFADSGNEIFVRLTEQLHIEVLAPLLALFFASMLVAEDIEMQTMPYILTRPIQRSAWVLGRFFAYLGVSFAILGLSSVMTFAASSTLAKLTLTNPEDLRLLLHYLGVMLVALAAYGGLAVFLGAFTRRPIVYGVLLLYGWQRIATLIPGVVDFMTIKKFVDALFPVLATQRNVVEVQTALGAFQKQVFMVSATKALATLLIVTVAFLAASIIAVRRREYASNKAVGG
ncbi:MAG: ABC transporter permease subunit [Candidatus Hydrogenedens sp.]|nr:ABC transporter permease [Candidatus Hydrogenedentota bacterium]NLF56297.1 ABC transporter permease subunit [Candidatus Hydrogenedens sp.]